MQPRQQQKLHVPSLALLANVRTWRNLLQEVLQSEFVLAMSPSLRKQGASISLKSPRPALNTAALH